MITAPHRIAALLPCTKRILPALARLFAGGTILSSTLTRLSLCRRLESIILIVPRGSSLPPLPDGPDIRGRVTVHEVDGELEDAGFHRRRVARSWSPTCWRGGIAGATCYDELLCYQPLLAALDAHACSAGLLIGPDWPLVDPSLCDAVVWRHLQQPDRLKCVFTQAPPGLSGCLIERSLLAELESSGTMIGQILEYQPRLPQGDPIAKDPCVQIEAAIRNSTLRYAAGEDRWALLLDRVAGRLGPLLGQAGAQAIVTAAADLGESVHESSPQQVTIELTSRRIPTGPIIPQSHLKLDRADLSLDQAEKLFAQFAGSDVALTLGDLGDPLLNPQWESIVQAAGKAGFAAIHLRTDLIVDQPIIEKIMRSPIDVVSVNCNADTAATYQLVMGVDELPRVMRNIEFMLNQRARFNFRGWVVPRMTKTADNVHELETFFDRWVYYCGHAVIDSPTTGGAAIPDIAVMNMAGPRRKPCRQIHHRLTIHSDGQAALCDQDWKAAHALPPADAWSRVQSVRKLHVLGEHQQVTPCNTCHEWHRP